MQLALTKDEAAFRDELREIYTTKIPAEIRERTRSGEGLDRDDLATSHKILHEHGLAVPQPSMDQLAAPATGAERQILRFHKGDREAAACGIQRHAYSRDAAPDDKYVEVCGRQIIELALPPLRRQVTRRELGHFGSF